MLGKRSRTCSRDHKHQTLEGGRPAEAAFYPLPLLRAILEGMSATAEAEQGVHNIRSEDYNVSLTMSICSVSENASEVDSKPVKDDAPTSEPTSHVPGTLPVQGGGTVKIKHEATDLKEVYHDEYTREGLPHASITEAITCELTDVNENVWVGVPIQTAKDDPEGKTS